MSKSMCISFPDELLARAEKHPLRSTYPTLPAMVREFFAKQVALGETVGLTAEQLLILDGMCTLNADAQRQLGYPEAEIVASIREWREDEINRMLDKPVNLPKPIVRQVTGAQILAHPVGTKFDENGTAQAYSNTMEASAIAAETLRIENEAKLQRLRLIHDTEEAAQAAFASQTKNNS